VEKISKVKMAALAAELFMNANALAEAKESLDGAVEEFDPDKDDGMLVLHAGIYAGWKKTVQKSRFAFEAGEEGEVEEGKTLEDLKGQDPYEVVEFSAMADFFRSRTNMAGDDNPGMLPATRGQSFAQDPLSILDKDGFRDNSRPAVITDGDLFEGDGESPTGFWSEDQLAGKIVVRVSCTPTYHIFMPAPGGVWHKYTVDGKMRKAYGFMACLIAAGYDISTGRNRIGNMEKEIW
jgi:hypothetical protein